MPVKRLAYLAQVVKRLAWIGDSRGLSQIRVRSKRPQRTQAKYGCFLMPVLALEWGWRWLACLLSGWAFLEVLEYFGTLSLLVAAVSYFAESKDRIKQKHYQAWQVINAAQGKGGSGGRIDALEELHQDGVPVCYSTIKSLSRPSVKCSPKLGGRIGARIGRYQFPEPFCHAESI
jgi:hypothetical protein